MHAIDANALIRPGQVHGRIYSDPSVYELEMEAIFGRTWVYVAHESEIPQPGDYKTTYIGTQPVIVSRGADDGEIHVLFNRCRHRGATVCQAECGNANYFRCAYHGWTYSNRGELTGVPFRQGYGSSFKTEEMGLVRVPRVDSYRGFIFASLSPEGQTLAEHLGHARRYLDYVANSGPEGIALKGGAQRNRLDGNWKFQLENSADPYHFSFVHQSFLQIMEERTGEKSRANWNANLMGNREWRSLDLGNGHGGIEYGQNGIGIGDMPFNLIIYPNLVLLGLQVRVIRPLAVDKTEVLLYPILLKGAGDEVNGKRLRGHEAFYGPAGFGYPDDTEVAFHRVRDGLQARGNEWMVISRGLGQEQVDTDGVRYGGFADELQFRAMFEQWRHLVDRYQQSQGDQHVGD